ncbi:MAG TPA: hypothetical protein VFC56_12310 [Stellaceae bacterium]|nr:hypothetical protein [Stellaceae bacterium]
MLKLGTYAPIADRDAAAYRDEAVLGLIDAQLACLYRRCAAVAGGATAVDIACQIRDATAARRALLAARNGARGAA